MKSEKLRLKIIFIIGWGILALAFLINIFTCGYSKYKKAQDYAVNLMLDITHEYDDYMSDRTKMIHEMYLYFTIPPQDININGYHIDRSEERYSILKLNESMAEMVKEEGLGEAFHVDYYYKYTSFSGYYFSHNTFLPIYIPIFLVYLLLNIFYVLSRKVSIDVSNEKINYKKSFKRNKEFMIKDVTSVENTFLKGIKIKGNSIKAFTLLVKNNKELKDYIMNLVEKNVPKMVKTNSDTSDADKLLKYKKLLDSGAITEEEYNKKKEEILKL